MKGKVISVLLRNKSAAGDYACADGEIESCDGLVLAAPVESRVGVDDSSPAPGAGGWQGRFPPAPEVEFSLERRVLPGWQGTSDMLPSAEAETKDNTAEGWRKEAARFIGDFMADARLHGLFVEPFFVLAALRLADGSRVSPTSPVLMIPNSEAPIVVAGDADLTVKRMTLRAVAAVCGLRCRVMNAAALREWRGEVTHLDIFVSSPVRLYDEGRDFVGHHRLEISLYSHSYGSSGRNGECRVAEDVFDMAWKPVAVSDAIVARRLAAVGDYRLVREIPLDMLAKAEAEEDEGVTEPYDIGAEGLEEGTYVPDYASLQGLEAAGRAEISGRATLYDLTLTVPEVPSLSALAPPHKGVLPEKERVAIEVEILRDGEILRSVRSSGEEIEIGEDCFPRWVFYPDPDAVRMTVATTSGTFIVPLRRHPLLRGAYWWCGGFGKHTLEGMGVEMTGSALQPEAPVAARRDSWHMPGGVWRSRKGNALAFPDKLLMRLDVSRVIYLCRAYRSSGLVATVSPTAYLFTPEGVFLLKETDDGSLRDAGLICGYVLGSPVSVKTVGRMLEFVTADGETIRIEGTTVRNVTWEAVRGGSAGGSVVITGEEGGSAGRFVTRPLKLGDGEGLKRISVVFLRGKMNPWKTKIAVYGSVNLRDWRLLASSSGRIGGLYGPSVRFVKVAVDATLTASETIEAIVIRLRHEVSKKR